MARKPLDTAGIAKYIEDKVAKVTLLEEGLSNATTDAAKEGFQKDINREAKKIASTVEKYKDNAGQAFKDVGSETRTAMKDSKALKDSTKTLYNGANGKRNILQKWFTVNLQDADKTIKKGSLTGADATKALDKVGKASPKKIAIGVGAVAVGGVILNSVFAGSGNKGPGERAAGVREKQAAAERGAAEGHGVA
jgi:hypothetical protein